MNVVVHCTIIVTTDEHYCYVFIAAHAHTQGGIQWLKLYSDPDYAETLCFDDVSTTQYSSIGYISPTYR